MDEKGYTEVHSPGDNQQGDQSPLSTLGQHFSPPLACQEFAHDQPLSFKWTDVW